MLLTLHYDEVKPRDVPVSELQLKKLVRWLARTLKGDAEYQETTRLIGRSPRFVSLLFCQDKKIRHFNKVYRKLDRATDILSFPMRETLLPAVSADGNLGDLIVSLPAIERGAKRGGRTSAEELVEVVIHGMLHLIGHDHIRSRARAKRMFSCQKQLFDKATRVIRLPHGKSRRPRQFIRRSSPSKSARTRR